MSNPQKKKRSKAHPSKKQRDLARQQGAKPATQSAPVASRPTVQNGGGLNKPKTPGSEPVVEVAMGAGTPAVQIAWRSGDTVATVLARGNFSIEAGKTATLGRRRVVDPSATPVQPGDVIVVAGTPANG